MVHFCGSVIYPYVAYLMRNYPESNSFSFISSSSSCLISLVLFLFLSCDHLLLYFFLFFFLCLARLLSGESDGMFHDVLLPIFCHRVCTPTYLVLKELVVLETGLALLAVFSLSCLPLEAYLRKNIWMWGDPVSRRTGSRVWNDSFGVGSLWAHWTGNRTMWCHSRKGLPMPLILFGMLALSNYGLGIVCMQNIQYQLVVQHLPRETLRSGNVHCAFSWRNRVS